MKIYTKTGDSGTTGLVGGDRVSKADPLMAAIGDVDELNAIVGVARTHSEDSQFLQNIQNWLFDLGAELATPTDSKFVNQSIGEKQITWLEASIDEMTSQLEPLRNFILPGGTAYGAALHHARTVCRRAERSVIALNAARPELIRFLNRLSDWLFVAARFANREQGDILWSKSEA